MKRKRSKKAKEQAGASAQSDTQRLRGEGKTTIQKPGEGRRAEERGTELDLEDGEERDEEEEDEEEDVEEKEEAQRGFPAGVPRSTDYVRCGANAGYPHSPFSEEEPEGIQVGGGDRKIRAGLWKDVYQELTRTLHWEVKSDRSMSAISVNVGVLGSGYLLGSFTQPIHTHTHKHTHTHQKPVAQTSQITFHRICMHRKVLIYSAKWL